MIPARDKLPRNFGFVGDDYYTTRTFQASLLVALGFSYEMSGPDADDRCMYRIYRANGNCTDMTLPQAVAGIHNPVLLRGSAQEKVKFHQYAKDVENRMLDEVRARKVRHDAEDHNA